MGKENEVIVEGQFRLAATLTIPDGNLESYTLIVMIHGSGPIDRDSSAKGLLMSHRVGNCVP